VTPQVVPARSAYSPTKPGQLAKGEASACSAEGGGDDLALLRLVHRVRSDSR
jgi:hypothetical protein